ncbi:unnamed protein product [Taenia asiatica]|uniref:NPL domain-containing protein n=1 Tax=Taenia asiatica TaxID=60517 RepID=A0A0R3WBR7_TAEAS|nr:unnamed protein product [Taenia asiatica]
MAFFSDSTLEAIEEKPVVEADAIGEDKKVAATSNADPDKSDAEKKVTKLLNGSPGSPSDGFGRKAADKEALQDGGENLMQVAHASSEDKKVAATSNADPELTEEEKLHGEGGRRKVLLCEKDLFGGDYKVEGGALLVQLFERGHFVLGATGNAMEGVVVDKGVIMETGGEEGLAEEDDETDVDKTVTEFTNADLGSVEKEIERKAAEGEVPADALMEDEQDVEAASASAVKALFVDFKFVSLLYAALTKRGLSPGLKTDFLLASQLLGTEKKANFLPN